MASKDLVEISRALSAGVERLSFRPPVAFVYNPIDYARNNFEAFLTRYAHSPCEAVFLGMNPGPFGMVQTGVPFGEVAAVREWLKIDEQIGRPEVMHPKRQVEGLACKRSEVSGRRFWGWAQERFSSPDAFARRFFVWNWCPLAFLEEGGRNRTPDKLPAKEREPLLALCDEALRQIVAALEPELVIGIGKFATDRARIALTGDDAPSIGTILHPSPASPMANRGWAPQAEAQLEALGVKLPVQELLG